MCALRSSSSCRNVKHQAIGRPKCGHGLKPCLHNVQLPFFGCPTQRSPTGDITHLPTSSLQEPHRPLSPTSMSAPFSRSMEATWRSRPGVSPTHGHLAESTSSQPLCAANVKAVTSSQVTSCLFFGSALGSLRHRLQCLSAFDSPLPPSQAIFGPPGRRLRMLEFAVFACMTMHPQHHIISQQHT